MKRCPQCGREYDNSMMFCLDDGAELLYGPAQSGSRRVGGGSEAFSITEPEIEARPVEVAPGFRAREEAEAKTAILPTTKPMRAAARNSIAVLPFAHLSSEPDDEFFCDGLAEELLNALTKIESLKVTARTSAFSFKGTNIPVSEIGRTLGVRTVIEGSVRKAGDRVRIAVQVVNASDGYHIWSDRYEREMKDIFALQDEITLAVVEALKVKLLRHERSAVLKKATDNPEAYELYLRGRFLWNTRSPDNLNKAIEHFEAAAEKDPEYALAYVGISDTYLMFEQYAGTPHAEVSPLAGAAVGRALEIDDSLAEAHAALGMVHQMNWDWLPAQIEFERALELNPNYPTARHWYSMLLKALGRYDEMSLEINRARELDPLSNVINANLAISYLVRDEFDAAVRFCRKMIEFDANYGDHYHYLGIAYLLQGNVSDAVATIEKAAELKRRSGEILGVLAYGYASVGMHNETISLIRDLENKFTERKAAGQNLALAYIGINDHDAAFEWLEKDFQAQSGILPFVRWYPLFWPLRGDKRYIDLLRRMNLPQ